MSFNDKPKLQIGALWCRVSENGNDYTAGTVKREALVDMLNRTTTEDIKIFLSVNKKQNDKQPDYKIIASDVDYIKTAPMGAAGDENIIPF